MEKEEEEIEKDKKYQKKKKGETKGDERTTAIRKTLLLYDMIPSEGKSNGVGFPHSLHLASIYSI